MFFVYGFAKNVRANIDTSDVQDFKDLAKVLLAIDDRDIERLINRGEYVEFHCNGDEKGV